MFPIHIGDGPALSVPEAAKACEPVKTSRTSMNVRTCEIEERLVWERVCMAPV
jgi:hypothetical protein